MQTSHFQLGLIATLAVGLGFSLASSEAVGYPAGAAVSYSGNPVVSVGGTLDGTETDAPLVAPIDQAIVITDVVLSAMDSNHVCRGGVRVDLSSDGSLVGRFSVGLAIPVYDYGDYQPINAVRLESGIRIDPGKSLTIQAPERNTWSCSGSGMEVHYTLSGYYAQP
jgi:hypothetical protein